MTAHAAIKNTFFEDFFVQKSLTIISVTKIVDPEDLPEVEGSDDQTPAAEAPEITDDPENVQFPKEDSED